jgi:hypothetical protein
LTRNKSPTTKPALSLGYFGNSYYFEKNLGATLKLTSCKENKGIYVLSSHNYVSGIVPKYRRRHSSSGIAKVDSITARNPSGE